MTEEPDPGVRSPPAPLRRVDLPGGAVLRVREVVPDDLDGLLALYRGLSTTDRYRRFFSGSLPPDDFFERMAAPTAAGAVELVATVDTGHGEDIVGEAGYVPLPDGDAELGMVVAERWRGWLGSYLLDVLAEVGSRRGIPNLEADVLASNRPMQRTLRRRGAVELDQDDWSIVRLLIGTCGSTPVWPPDHRHRRVLVELPAGRWTDPATDDDGATVVLCRGPEHRVGPCPALAGEPCPLAAGADLIVCGLDPGSETGRALLDAHARLHPGVPVHVDDRHARASAGSEAPDPPAPPPEPATG
jgi:GNAT superfamily N-acetyltransferase